MRELANGEDVKPIRFRSGDFWQDLAKDFNTVARRAGSVEKHCAENGDVKEEPEAKDEPVATKGSS